MLTAIHSACIESPGLCPPLEMAALIYDAPLGDPPWSAFVRAFRQQLRSHIVHFSFRLLREDDRGYGVGDAPVDVSGLYSDYQQRWAAHNPLDYESMTPGRLYSLRDFTGGVRLEDCAFYIGNLRPAGFDNLYCLPIGEPTGSRAYLQFVRRAEVGPLTPEEEAWCVALAPHLLRGLKVFERLRLLQLSNGLYSQALESLSIGTLILDGQARVLFFNTLAHRILADCREAHIKDEHLGFRNPVHSARLRRALKADTLAETQVLRLKSRGGHEVGAVLKRIVPQDEPGDARLIVYLHDLSIPPQIPQRALVELFGLAPAEASLAALLVAGWSLQEAAVQLGVTENTVRSYCRRIFRKAGISRQTELVRLVLRSVAMLSADSLPQGETASRVSK